MHLLPNKPMPFSCISVLAARWPLEWAKFVAPVLFMVALFVAPTTGHAKEHPATTPVQFEFRPGVSDRDPWARELWAEIVTPSGTRLHVPAYFVGDGAFAVRARADEAGDYRLGNITETAADSAETIALAGASIGPAKVHVTAAARETRLAVERAAGSPPRLAFTDGSTYAPFGTNLAWAPTKDRIDWYRDAFRDYSAAGLNWTRVWMAHWGGLNLDWLPPGLGRSPPFGELDFRVADDWDRILSAAEQNGLYVQVVLQHHGQYSSEVNSNWPENPWNAANHGGFLPTTADFFTSPRAIALTKRKYRYIVARWGYSPAVLAWELFNEVHWVDALRKDHDVAAVARWHDEMAAYLRLIDPYHHLVTTSTDDVRSPIYASMDYLQPHLYAVNMLAAVRRFAVTPDHIDRPVFYGEIGNDHMPLTPEQKAAGVEFAPIAWASLMGTGRYPGQLWEGATVLAHHQLGEIAAVARFLAATKLGERDGLTPFAAVVESTSAVPLRLVPGEAWQRHPASKIAVATDGRALSDYASIPQFVVGSSKSIAEGYPDRIAFQVAYSQSATVRVRLADAGPLGSAVRVMLDGREIAHHSWPALAAANPAAKAAPASASKSRPAELQFSVAPGSHEMVLQNTGGADWFEFASIDLGLKTSALAAVGRRDADFIAVWIWQRDAIFALAPPAPVSGRLILPDVAAGTWRVTWWDTTAGTPSAVIAIEHPGGALELSSPPIGRHAAVALTREPSSPAGD